MIVGIAVATIVLSSAARNMPAIAAIVVRTMRRLPSRAAYSVPVSPGTPRTLLERSFKFKPAGALAQWRRGGQSEVVSELAGRISVITGAGSGLGAAMAHAFAQAGMAVAALDIDASGAAATAAAAAEEFDVPTTSARVDVGDSRSVAEAARHVETTLGGCDLLCANVGVQQFGAIDRLSEHDWEWLLNVNVLGTVRTVREFLPLLRARAGWRRILLTASSSVLAPSVRLGGYQTTKYAVMGFGDTLREELADEGIGVTVLFPGGMMTRHLESSALARPKELGESSTDP